MVFYILRAPLNGVLYVRRKGSVPGPGSWTRALAGPAAAPDGGEGLAALGREGDPAKVRARARPNLCGCEDTAEFQT